MPAAREERRPGADWLSGILRFQRPSLPVMEAELMAGTGHRIRTVDSPRNISARSSDRIAAAACAGRRPGNSPSPRKCVDRGGSGESTLSFAPFRHAIATLVETSPDRAIREGTSRRPDMPQFLRLRTSPAGFIGHRNCPFVVARRCQVQRRPKVAATNKCLARSNKSRTRFPATNKGPAARRNSPAQHNSAQPIWQDPLRGQRCRSFTALWRRELSGS